MVKEYINTKLGSMQYKGYERTKIYECYLSNEKKKKKEDEAKKKKK